MASRPLLSGLEGEKMNSLSSKLARILIFSFCILIIPIFVQSIAAQETRGTIRGTVTDPNKQAVYNATVQ